MSLPVSQEVTLGLPISFLDLQPGFLFSFPLLPRLTEANPGGPRVQPEGSSTEAQAKSQHPALCLL